MRIDPTFDVQSSLQKPLGQTKTEGSSSFGNILSDAMNNVNQSENEDSQDTLALLSGNVDDIHSSMIAMEKADIAIQFTTQIRNKILDAYNEIMRMQL